jgi:hypothetical protein
MVLGLASSNPMAMKASQDHPDFLGTEQKQLRQFWLGLLPAGFVARSLPTHWQGMLVACASPAGKIPAP